MFQEVLNRLKKELTYDDKEYEKKYHHDMLIDRFDEINNGCVEFTKKLENINSFDVHTYDTNISNNILNGKTNQKMYFYIACPEFSNFVKEFNKQNKNIQINVNKKDVYVNTISVDKDGVKDNKIIYNLSRVDTDYMYNCRTPTKYDIYPNTENVFMC